MRARFHVVADTETGPSGCKTWHVVDLRRPVLGSDWCTRHDLGARQRASIDYGARRFDLMPTVIMHRISLELTRRPTIPTPIPSPPGERRAASGWPESTDEAIELQRRLSSRIVEFGRIEPPSVAAGADLHIRRSDGIGIATVVAVSVPDLEVLELVTAMSPVDSPYVPGLLSFRELPPLLAAFAELQVEPDVVLVDGHGRSHPRRFGLVCDLGLELDVPTVGCAKSRLVGEAGAVGSSVYATADLVHKGELVGTLMRSKARCSPLYISIGHRIALENAVQVVSENLDGYKLPIALRLAHESARESAIA